MTPICPRVSPALLVIFHATRKLRADLLLSRISRADLLATRQIRGSHITRGIQLWSFLPRRRSSAAIPDLFVRGGIHLAKCGFISLARSRICGHVRAGAAHTLSFRSKAMALALSSLCRCSCHFFWAKTDWCMPAKLPKGRSGESAVWRGLLWAVRGSRGLRGPVAESCLPSVPLAYTVLCVPTGFISHRILPRVQPSAAILQTPFSGPRT